MAENPVQRVYPYLHYADAPAAIAFLQQAFGFEEQMRMGAEDQVMHAELALEGTVVMLASTFPDTGQTAQQDLPGYPSSVMFYVDDVDAHFDRAKAGGAAIVQEPEDQFWGDRVYTCNDCEGHRWTFATKVRDVSPEEMVPPEGMSPPS